MLYEQLFRFFLNILKSSYVDINSKIEKDTLQVTIEFSKDLGIGAEWAPE